MTCPQSQYAAQVVGPGVDINFPASVAAGEFANLQQTLAR